MTADMRLKFKSGGDPAHIPAVWYGGRIIAFWPASLPPPTEDQANEVLRVWMKGDGSALGRQEMEKMFGG